MLINLTNHPSKNWPPRQIKEAVQHYGTIADIAFPQIDPQGNEAYIEHIANEYLKKTLDLLRKDIKNTNNAVHIMGELTLCFALVALLQKRNITCLASTSKRVAKENDKGEKVSVFSFVKFRQYPNLCKV
ncbi:MAG: CRISPR-associated protein [Bacteroidota bacterium]